MFGLSRMDSMFKVNFLFDCNYLKEKRACIDLRAAKYSLACFKIYFYHMSPC